MFIKLYIPYYILTNFYGTKKKYFPKNVYATFLIQHKAISLIFCLV